MKIRIVLADTDENYIRHFMETIKKFYFEKVEIISFSKKDAFCTHLESHECDAILAEVSFFELCEKYSNALILSEEKDVREIKGNRALCKYQKIDVLYKGILDFIAEQKTDITYVSATKKESPVIAFTSASGGVGKTTASLVYARQLVQKGYQVLFLSLENYSNTDYYLSGEGEGSFSNVLFAIKCGKGNLQLKVESSLKRTQGGLYYLSQPESPGEFLEMNQEDWEKLFLAVQKMGKYHCIVLDLPVAMDETSRNVLPFVDKIVAVTDGRDIVEDKNQKMILWLQQMKILKESMNEGKLLILRNKSQGVMNRRGKLVTCQLPYVVNAVSENAVIENLSNGKKLDVTSIYQPEGEKYV